jgi:hypothetical protein
MICSSVNLLLRIVRLLGGEQNPNSKSGAFQGSRSKSSVKKWPTSNHRFNYDFSTGVESKLGYYWIAYDILNYAASCKQCNSPLKSNFFPIVGKRQTKPTGAKSLVKEKPLLCYPIGDKSEDPESLIEFLATTAVPVFKSGAKHRRGRVIIDFFELNLREQLHRERARMLIILGDALVRLETSPSQLDTRLVQSSLAPETPHASCSRSFERLWNSNQPIARQVLVKCKQYLVSNDLAKIYP